MIVLGVDPGRTVGLACIEVSGSPVRGMSAWWCWGSVASVEQPGTLAWEGQPVSTASSFFLGEDLVALEDVQGYPFGQQNFVRAKHLLEAAKIGERIAAAASHAGVRVERMTAGRARSIIVGRNNPSDAAVKEAIYRLVRGVPSRTNAHVRDAVVVALAVGWTKGGLRGP